MKRLLAAVTLTALTFAAASPAMSADLAVKARPLPPPIAYSWSGCYVGVQAGYANHNAVHTDVGYYSFGGSWEGWSHGGTVGALAGCNLQYGSFVYGIEVDGNWLSNKEEQLGYYY